MPGGLDINHLIDDLRIISWEAAEILIYYSNQLKNEKFHQGLIKIKDNDEPVSLADLKVNELIISRIREKYNYLDWHLLSEENGIIKFNNSKINNWLWVLDPLDGTRDFLQKTSNYALHLALNYQNKPYLGIVLIPEKDELWISNNKMVWCENKAGVKQKFKLDTNKKKITDMTLVTSKNHKNQVLKNIIDTIKFRKSIVIGSIGCKIASILRGESDIYISMSLPGQSSPKDWDFAAPESILIAAGGAITDIDNKELIYNKPEYKQEGMIVASNNKNNHEEICSQLKKKLSENNIYPFN